MPPTHSLSSELASGTETTNLVEAAGYGDGAVVAVIVYAFVWRGESWRTAGFVMAT